MQVCMQVPENRSFGPLYLFFVYCNAVRNNSENNNAVIILLATLVAFKILLQSPLTYNFIWNTLSLQIECKVLLLCHLLWRD